MKQMIQACVIAWVTLAWACGGPVLAKATETESAAPQKPEHAVASNKQCLKCHGDEDEKTFTLDNGKEVFIYVDHDKLKDSVHGKQPCQGCHANVTLVKGEHEEGLPISVSCVKCHQEKWKEQKDSSEPSHKRLGVVMQQIDSYMHSVHARPSLADQSKTNATCHDCHDAHDWIPACAGMTTPLDANPFRLKLDSRLRGNDDLRRPGIWKLQLQSIGDINSPVKLGF